VSAIYQDTSVPDPWKHYIALNAEKVKQCPSIKEKKERQP